MSADDIVIVAAQRTPVGGFNGGLSSLPAHALGEVVIRALLEKTGVKGEEISEVVFGQVLTAGTGGNPTRQALVNAGLPHAVPGWTVNQVCGSGLRSVALGYQAIKLGDSSIVIAGGQESMSQAPHAVQLRDGVKMGPATLVDTMINDALTDPFNRYHMGVTAENLAKKYEVTRDEQDAFALLSQQKAGEAMKEGRFRSEIVPVTVKQRKGDVVVEADEHPRPETNIESLAKLRPAFDKEGTVTAGNASGINDGAAAVLLMKRGEAEKRGLLPLATIKSWAHAGVDPSIMGIGPVPATQKALQRAGWSLEDVDLFELNEAFAAQALAVNRELKIPEEKINVNGGAIALGHPVGASGCRVLVTLVHEMARRDAKKGLATLCIGGGMGVALAVERG